MSKQIELTQQEAETIWDALAHHHNLVCPENQESVPKIAKVQDKIGIIFQLAGYEGQTLDL